MSWYVLYTKPRNEKKTAKLLEDKGIMVYCPLQETVKQWSDRKKKVSEPIFKSYIFVFLNDYEKEREWVLTTQGAVKFLWWQKKPGIVREEEINEIKEFLNSYKTSKINISYNAGDEVLITEGPFRNTKGEILQIKNNKAVLRIPSLGWNLTAEIGLGAIK